MHTTKYGIIKKLWIATIRKITIVRVLFEGRSEQCQYELHCIQENWTALLNVFLKKCLLARNVWYFIWRLWIFILACAFRVRTASNGARMEYLCRKLARIIIPSSSCGDTIRLVHESNIRWLGPSDRTSSMKLVWMRRPIYLSNIQAHWWAERIWKYLQHLSAYWTETKRVYCPKICRNYAIFPGYFVNFSLKFAARWCSSSINIIINTV